MPRRRNYKKKRRPRGRMQRAYKKIKRKQAYRKKRSVVRRAATQRVSRMVPMGQTMTKIVKFEHHSCDTYRLHPKNATVGILPASKLGDGEAWFPYDGINIAQNDIFNPTMQAVTAGNYPTIMAEGFMKFSKQYGRYKVLSSRTSIKVRRIGGATPYTGSINNQITAIVGAGATAPSQSQQINQFFDPANADPLLLIVVDRNNYQDINSSLADNQIETYVDCKTYGRLGGIKWRELKPGAGQAASFSKRYSVRGKVNTTGGKIQDGTAGGTGTFQGVNGMGITPTGTSPLYVDKINYKIRPFDANSPYKMYYQETRVIVTVDVEYVVKATEPRYSLSNNTQTP